MENLNMAGKSDKKTGEGPSNQTGRGVAGNMDKLYSFATAIGKWQSTLTEERRQQIRNQFVVPRNDPDDPFKPNSEMQVTIISEQPMKKALGPKETEMLDAIGASYDYCLPLDIVNWPHSLPNLSDDCREQLEKIPTWLKALILLRFDKIQAYFGDRTHLFLRMLANWIDYQRSIPITLFEMEENDDEEDYFIINKKFLVDTYDVDSPFHKKRSTRKSFKPEDLFRIAHAIALWRLPKSARVEWAPNHVHRAAQTLRRALLTQASPADIAMVAEDEVLNALKDESDDEDLYKATSWRDIFCENAEFRAEIQRAVEEDFETVPHHFRWFSEKVAPKIQKMRAKKKKKEELIKEQKRLEAAKIQWYKRHKLFAIKRKVYKGNIENLLKRGLHRRYSRIWYKDCPIREIEPTRKRAHHYRYDEGFHAYILELVESSFFRWFIMAIIVMNAALLAIETGDFTTEHADVYEIVDDFFLSVYLIEFFAKVYANPQKFWRSGFNVFDFIILVASIIKSAADWFGWGEVQILRVFVIVRALRILRGVSLNIQIQVLVTAMVETLRTHVLSVLILLLLLMYITAIIAFYLFGDIVPKNWGHIGHGMKNLFAFFVMDGWTELVKQFKIKGYLHSGRIFALLGIVLGNFFFANIFIAIIIMQISEATDAFRNKQMEEREVLVKRKKQIVYRRQKLDMRQLLARQKLSLNADFYYLADQFQRLLRHDDLIETEDVMCSPMWIDCINKASHRCLHTSNVLMNLHRKVADHLHDIYHVYNDVKPIIRPIRRARYNRCVRLKAKLTSLKNEFYDNAHAEDSIEVEEHQLKIKLPPLTKKESEKLFTFEGTDAKSKFLSFRKSIKAMRKKRSTALQKLQDKMKQKESRESLDMGEEDED